jgi:hypothetical protein
MGHPAVIFYLLHSISPQKINGDRLGYEDAPSSPQYPTTTLVWIDTFVQ